MPTYEFTCSKCGEEFEKMSPIALAPSQARCPICTHPSPRAYRTAPCVSTWAINMDYSKNDPVKEEQDQTLMGYKKKIRLQSSPVLDAMVKKRNEKVARAKLEGWSK